MIWMGEECYCWHRVNEALNFLDGLSPKETKEQLYVHGRWPRVMEEFRQSEIGKNLESNHPEWLTRMHAAVWEHYGQRLFELFSLRRPGTWHNYSRFIKEYYEIKGIHSDIIPFQYKIC